METQRFQQIRGKQLSYYEPYMNQNDYENMGRNRQLLFHRKTERHRGKQRENLFKNPMKKEKLKGKYADAPVVAGMF